MDAKDLLIKGSIGLAGAGAIGFAGYQAINSKTETKEINNIQKRLEKAGYTPITEASASYAEILKSYVAVTKEKSELKFDEFTGADDTVNNKKAKDILWEHCQKTFAEESDTNFNKAKKWCVEQVSVKDFISKKLTALDTTSEDGDIVKKWDSKVKKYRAKATSEKAFGALEIGTGDAVDKGQRTLIKNECTKAEKIKNHEDKYEENLKNFEDWCTDKE